MDEFSLIERYFTRAGRHRPDVELGIGDDAALCRVPEGMSLVAATDTLVEGVHFPESTPAGAVGHKALAVNLSDLAAMGADPAWFTLALSLPQADETWLQGFADGLFSLADRFACELVGGDTVRGPRVITVQALGLVPAGMALQRRGAAPGDRIYVSGTLGDAALGLALERRGLQAEGDAGAYLRGRLDRPEPRVELGRGLRGIATAAIDISDGLVADLGHVLKAGRVGARVSLSRLPLSSAYNSLREQAGWEPALSGGDDYELCFTVPPDKLGQLEQEAPAWSCEVCCIGEVVAGSGLFIEGTDGKEYRPQHSGHDHFSGGS